MSNIGLEIGDFWARMAVCADGDARIQPSTAHKNSTPAGCLICADGTEVPGHCPTRLKAGDTYIPSVLSYPQDRHYACLLAAKLIDMVETKTGEKAGRIVLAVPDWAFEEWESPFCKWGSDCGLDLCVVPRSIATLATRDRQGTLRAAAFDVSESATALRLVGVSPQESVIAPALATAGGAASLYRSVAVALFQEFAKAKGFGGMISEQSLQSLSDVVATTLSHLAASLRAEVSIANLSLEDGTRFDFDLDVEAAVVEPLVLAFVSELLGALPSVDGRDCACLVSGVLGPWQPVVQWLSGKGWNEVLVAEETDAVLGASLLSCGLGIRVSPADCSGRVPAQSEELAVESSNLESEETTPEEPNSADLAVDESPADENSACALEAEPDGTVEVEVADGEPPLDAEPGVQPDEAVDDQPIPSSSDERPVSHELEAPPLAAEHEPEAAAHPSSEPVPEPVPEPGPGAEVSLEPPPVAEVKSGQQAATEPTPMQEVEPEPESQEGSADAVECVAEAPTPTREAEPGSNLDDVKAEASDGPTAPLVEAVPEAIGELRGSYTLVSGPYKSGLGSMSLASADTGGQRRLVRMIELRSDTAGEERSLRVVERVRRASDLKSPSAVGILEVGTTASGWVYVEDHGDWPMLREVLQRRGCLAPKDAAGLAAKLADALEGFRSQGLYHRNICPANIVVSPDLSDLRIRGFEIAVWLSPGQKMRSVAGLLAYIAPEVLSGASDHTADIYSAGIVLFEMLTGRPPFQAQSAEEMKRLVLSSSIPRLRSFSPSLGTDLEKILDAALDRNPSVRSLDATSLLRAVR